jgi:hypothetical protein
MKALILLFLLLFSLAPQATAASDTMEIYIRNKPLMGERIKRGDEIYASAAELRKLLHGDISWDVATGAVLIDGNATSIKLIVINNTQFLPLKATAKAMGYEVSFNKNTGILDVYTKIAVKEDVRPAGQVPMPATTAAPPKSQQTQAGNDLTITEGSIYEDPKYRVPNSSPDSAGTANYTDLPGIHFNAIVFNGRSTDARNVVATCTITQPNGTVCAQQDYAVGTLRPGEKKEAFFYFAIDAKGRQLYRYFRVRDEKMP